MNSKPFYKFRPRKHVKHEEKIQVRVCKYIQAKYPDAVYINEASGVRLPIGLAKIQKDMRCKHKLPDIIILQPKKITPYDVSVSVWSHGFAMELKDDADKVFKKDGKVRQNKHILSQKMTLEHLAKLGYWVCWGLGYQDAITKIDAYMKQ